MKECFDVVDENNNFTGRKVPRDIIHKKGLWHRGIRVLIVNSRNEILCHCRHPSKDTFPNHWDIQCGGHVGAGESYEDAGIRELKEEFGIKTNKCKLKHMGITKYEAIDHGTNTVIKEFHCDYLYRLQKGDKIVFQRDEISEIKWMKMPEVRKELLSSNPKMKFIPRQALRRNYLDYCFLIRT